MGGPSLLQPRLGRAQPAGRYKSSPAPCSSLDFASGRQSGSQEAEGSLGPAHTPHQVGVLPAQRAEGVDSQGGKGEGRAEAPKLVPERGTVERTEGHRGEEEDTGGLDRRWPGGGL